ncbi:MAG: hypothetical protein JXR23_08755 [Pontiellaceae bacterium]|nr:hypothetical protein [Pontiellaceae bacterium]
MSYRNSIPVEMKIVRQGMFHELGKAFGMQDILTGNAEFDYQLLVKGADTQRVRGILSTPVQDAIIDLLSSFDDITITDSHIEAVKSGTESDSFVIIQTLRRLEEFCEVIMEADENSSAAPYAMDLENEVESEEEPEVDSSETPYIPSITVDPFAIPNPVVVTEELPEFSEEEIPSIPVPPEHQRFESEPNPAKDETVREEFAAPQAAATTAAKDIQDIARQLFVDPENSMLTSTQFDEHFKDIAVTGTGKMGHVARFSYDPVFSDTKGVKASCDVCTLDGTYSKIRVSAEVMYPEDQYERLNALQAQTIPINGNLVAYNSITHRLYLIAL